MSSSGVTHTLPVFGLVFDTVLLFCSQDIIGMRGILALFCSIATIPVFGLLAFTEVHPLVCTL